MLCIDIKSRNHAPLAPFVPILFWSEYTYKLVMIGLPRLKVISICSLICVYEKIGIRWC